MHGSMGRGSASRWIEERGLGQVAEAAPMSSRRLFFAALFLSYSFLTSLSCIAASHHARRRKA